MNFDSIDDLRQQGFIGFLSIASLQSDCSMVPDNPGVYLVLRFDNKQPAFLETGTGGWFKGRDPNVKVSLLESKWVEDACALYIGKAGGPNQKTSLKTRLQAYMRFGQGKRVAKWGGRYIWQLRNSRDLLMCWKTTPDDIPENAECRLIQKFVAQYGKLPFANLNRGIPSSLIDSISMKADSHVP
jgi:hypothetical protein